MRTSLLVFMVLAVPAYAQLPFPANSTGTSLGGGLSSAYESSGLVWHPTQNALFGVGDNGQIARISSTGTVQNIWNATGNFEAITYANAASNFVYVSDENGGLVKEFNFGTGTGGGTVTRSFNLLSAAPASGVPALTSTDITALNGTGNKGVEGLAFLPVAGDPQGGIFLAGSQENATIYKFRLSLDAGTTVTYLGKAMNWTQTGHLSDISYDPIRDRVLVLFDTDKRILQLKPDLTLEATYAVPSGNSQEGIAVNGTSLFIARDDDSHTIIRYDNFAPVPEPVGILVPLALIALRRTRSLRMSS